MDLVATYKTPLFNYYIMSSAETYVLFRGLQKDEMLSSFDSAQIYILIGKAMVYIKSGSLEELKVHAKTYQKSIEMFAMNHPDMINN